MVSMRHGRDYQEDAAFGAAIAAVAAANEADAEADAGAVYRSDAKAMDAAIFDFAASI